MEQPLRATAPARALRRCGAPAAPRDICRPRRPDPQPAGGAPPAVARPLSARGLCACWPLCAVGGLGWSPVGRFWAPSPGRLRRDVNGDERRGSGHLGSLPSGRKAGRARSLRAGATIAPGLAESAKAAPTPRCLRTSEARHERDRAHPAAGTGGPALWPAGGHRRGGRYE